MVLLLAATAAGLAWAQSTAPPPVPPSAVPPSATGSGSAMLAAAIVVALLVFLGIIIKLLDLKRRRESETVQLQAQISDALLREEALFGLPVTATAHVPLWSGTPATIVLTGQVRTPELREAVLRVVPREAARVRPDFHVEDRLAIVPNMARAA